VAGDKSSKTEKPTAKRKAESRKQGQIAKSPDLVSWLGVLVATYLLPSALARGAGVGVELFEQVHQTMLDPSVASMSATARLAFGGMASLLGPLLAGMVLIAVIGNLAQTGFVLSTKVLKPSLKRLNPMAGLKRQFSAKNFWELGKNVAKLAVVSLVAYPAVIGITNAMPHDQQSDFWTVVAEVGSRSLALVRRVAQIALVISVADFAYQKRSIGKSLMMSKQEVRDEAKQAEGSGEVKAKIKSKQREISRNRMLSFVRTADVVVVNPVHIAVALKYVPLMGAPRVVAKGDSWLAEKIRSEAEQHLVPIVESIPLARALYASVDLEDEIGAEFYEPVARLLAFVHRLGKRRPMGGPHHRLPESLALDIPTARPLSVVK
jgi:flagellar biosynthesis protein FlhB